MKKLYKVILALAISLGCVSAFAEGTAEQTPTTIDGVDGGVAISSYGNTVLIKNADGEVANVYAIFGGVATASVVVDGQVTVEGPTGYYVVVVGDVSKTVFIQK